MICFYFVISSANRKGKNIVTKKKIKTKNYEFVDYERERKREIVIINK